MIVGLGASGSIAWREGVVPCSMKGIIDYYTKTIIPVS